MVEVDAPFGRVLCLILVIRASGDASAAEDKAEVHALFFWYLNQPAFRTSRQSNTKIMKYFIMLLTSVCFITVKAQDAVCTQGGIASLDNIQISWTLGELITGDINGENGVLTHGVQQPQITVIKLGSDSNQDPILVFPNPVSERLTIKLPAEEVRGIDYVIHSPSGTKFIGGSIQKDTEIDLSAYPTGTYLLEITSSKSSKTFKIIKSN